MNAGVQLTLSDEFLEELVERVTARVLEHLDVERPEPSPFLSVEQACAFLGGCSRQRIYDLRSSGRLGRYGDGTRVLISRAELQEHVRKGQA